MPPKHDDGPAGGIQHPVRHRPQGMPPTTGGQDNEPRIHSHAVGDSAADYETQRSDSLALPNGPSGNTAAQMLPTESRDDLAPIRQMPDLTPTCPESLINRDEVSPIRVSRILIATDPQSAHS